MIRWKIRSLFYTCCFYAYFAVGGLGFTFFVAPWVFLMKPFTSLADDITFTCAAFFFKGLRWMLEKVGAIRIAAIEGLENLYAHSPCIYVSNHRSILEVLLYLEHVPRSNCLMKAAPRMTRFFHYEETARERRHMPGWWTPFIAVVFHFLDYIPMPADKTDREGLQRTVAACRHSLVNRRSVIIFPEGTRSRTGHLLPFQMLAFKVAVAESIPMVPIIIHHREPIMPRGKATINIRETAIFRIKICPPIMPDEFGDPESLRLKVRRLMMKHLNAFNGEYGEFRTPD